LKVLHCLNHFLPSQTAGTEIYTWALCKGLQQQNVIAEVAIPNYGKNETTKYEYDGIKVYQFAEPSVVDRALQMGFKMPAGVPHFIKLITELKPDIIHFHELAGSNGFTLHYVKEAKLKGFKTIMTFHIADYSCKAKTLMYKNAILCNGIIDEYRCSECMLSKGLSPAKRLPVLKIAKLLYKWNIDLSHFNSRIATALSYPFLIQKLKVDLLGLEKSCDKLVVLTTWYEKILFDNGLRKEKISIITQGLIHQLSGNDETVSKVDQVKLKLIFVGRISPFKGVHLILDALERFQAHEICLDVYGTGNEQYAKDCIGRMEQSEKVKYKNKLEPSSVVKKMMNYDALVLASTFSEMSPLVIQEAFAAGIPVIASDVYGNAGQIENGVNGWLFKFNDSDNLYKVLKFLVDNKQLIALAKQQISPARLFNEVVDEYKQIYSDLMN